MPNRERLRVTSTPTRRGRESAADAWVFIAFCVIGYAAMVLLVFLSTAIG
jgi:hypothetical protein